MDLTPRLTLVNPPDGKLEPTRECGDCRLCCRVLAVQEIDKPRGKWCEHACGKGCAIYDKRPTQCREFECVWRLVDLPEAHPGWREILGPGDRPDKIKAVFTAFLGGMRDPRNGNMYRGVIINPGEPGVSEGAERVILKFLQRGYAVARNDSQRCVGIWFPASGLHGEIFWKIDPKHKDAKLTDNAKQTPEQLAETRAEEAQARLQIEARESGL